MRLRSTVLNGYNGQTIDKNGGVLTLPLILTNGTPTNPLEAVTKQYVDSKLDNVDASSITGIFAAARLPPLSGTDVSSAGGGVLTLTDTAVVPGTYTKLTVDAKGRVTAGSNLTTLDIPNFSFTKLTTDKPTTLAGYGITDGMSVTGGSFTGSLLHNAAPTAPTNVANKEYVDGKVGAAAGTGDFVYKTGDIIAKSSVAAQPGFLRCNGAKVNKTVYSALYTAIGEAHYVRTGDGVSSPWKSQYALNLAGTLSPNGTAVSPAMTVPSGGYFNYAFSTKNRAFFSNGQTAALYSIAVLSDGTLGTGGAVANMFPAGVAGQTYTSAFLTKNKVWMTMLAANTVDYALWKSTIATDGTLSAFTLHRSATWLTQFTKGIRVKNRMYFFETNMAPVSGQMEYGYCPIDANEDLGAFISLGSVATNVKGISFIDVAIIKNKLVLLVKSWNSGSSTWNGVVPYYATINADDTLGVWATGPVIGLAVAYNANSSVRADLGFLLNTTDGIHLVYQGERAGGGGTIDPKLVRNQLNVDANGVPVSWGAEDVLHTNSTFFAFDRKLTALFTSSKMFIPGTPQGTYISMYQFTYANGINDWSPYYDGSIFDFDAVNFNVPSLQTEEKAGYYWYIKH